MAQWLEQMTADQQVPGSIRAGGHGFTFMTCSDNPMNQICQMFISKSPNTTKLVKMGGRQQKKGEGGGEVAIKKEREALK